MTIALPGVFSNIDYTALVSKLTALNGQAVTRLQQRERNWEQKVSAVQDIRNRLSSLQALVDDLRDAAMLRGTTAGSSDSTILTASGDGTASEGAHSVEVHQLATVQRMVHIAGLAAQDTLVGAGQFTYTYDGTTRTTYTTAATTLAGLRDVINNDSANPGVRASILEYNGTFHLVLGGTDTGAGHTIVIDDVNTTIAGFDTADFVVSQAAQDALFRVDGYPAGDWISSASNTVSEVIPGVRLSLKSTGTATVTLGRSTDRLAADLSNLVSIYNGIMTKVKQYTGYGADSKTGGILQGDGFLTGMFSQLRSILNRPGLGFPASDAIRLADQIGLSMDKEGMLKLDADKLNEALQDNYDAALALIGAANTGLTNNDRIRFTSAMEQTTAGKYFAQVTFDETGAITHAGIRQDGQVEWRDMTVNVTTLTGQAGNPEAGLTLSANWDSGRGAYTETVTVNVRQGFAGGLYDKLTDLLNSTSGAIAQRLGYYDSTIKSLKRNIDLQQRLLDQRNEALKLKFARLETALARLDNQRGAVQAAVQAMQANSNTNT